MSADKNVVIIGTGIFGTSTALYMLEKGGYNVTMLDKCGILPAPDAASTDLNKIVRAGDYADPAYAQLAIDAVELWKKPEWDGCYHESGVICLSSPDKPEGAQFVKSAFTNLKAASIDATLVPDTASIKSHFEPSIPTGSFGSRQGYSNPVGGWAEAGRAVEVGLARVRQLGGTIRAGAEVVALQVGGDGKTVEAVTLEGGEDISCDLLVCAAGAWTPKLFASSGIAARSPPVNATGQSVATVQLTPEEMETYSKVPVVFNLDDGFYVFPPNPQGLVKFAIHAAGYTNSSPDSNGVSVPRTKLTPGAEDGMIPLEKLQKLRAGLAEVYPELAKKDLVSTRLCWYCDTISGDWLIDYHPDYTNLVLATGGSGHAFKYYPIIGREILKVIEHDPPKEFAHRWSFGYDGADAGADVRVDTVKELKLDDLASADDLRVSVTA
ncbi:FAD dependent oxidoreductase [Naematelia encephala]|uniref:FAD dependent oxidoreductase n=1 Tax=Naematelia encephala TaxID=71784 RepID=A0A1Y2BDG9_9TREE|nr:FAD dependent oxidoreductase [Naematelia encephala]